MKLCIVSRNIIRGDGQGRANYEIVKEALSRGHQVTIFSDGLEPDLRHEPGIKWVPAEAEKVPSAFLHQIVFGRRSAAWLKKHRHEFDLVQSYGSVTPASSDINTVQFVHSAWIQSPAHTLHTARNKAYGLYQWGYGKLNSYWEKSAFRKSDLVIAVSEKIRQDLMDIGVPRAKTRVIHNGVDIDEFLPGKLDRQTWNLPQGVPLALFAGDIRTSRKNLDSVLKALKNVPGLHLAVLGGTDGSPYPAMADELNLNDRVHFLGFRKDVAQVMRAVDFFVFPSRYEACTLVLMEAMASGLPVITASSAGGAELVSEDCGFVLSDSEDISQLATHLTTLAQNPQQREAMGQAARHLAEQHLWVSKAKLYNDLFEEFLTNQSGQCQPIGVH
jgi:glycosyltransferase involved in cell wall biosynthesis